MTKYYFVRHGESTANIDGVSAGWSDVPLTDNGWSQARKVAQEIHNRDIEFDIIISSPLTRALDTAKVIANVNDYPEERICILSELREKSSGTLELAPLHQIFETSEEGILEYGGENAEVFQGRVLSVLEKIRELGRGKDTVLLVAHSGIYKMAKVISGGLEPATKMYDIDIPKNADLLELPI